MEFLKRNGHVLLSLYVAFIFIQSLFFKFADSPETLYIFEAKLEPWAAGLGFPGLFRRGGIFSAYVIGSFELVASTAILVGAFVPKLRIVQALGALLGVGVMSGAISFHLFTPLGVQVLDADGQLDHGLLFANACGVWLGCAVLVWIRRDLLLALVGMGRPAAQ